MMKGDSFESPRALALKGSRVAELLKQPQCALRTTLQAGGVSEDALKASPAGVLTQWKDNDVKTSFRQHAQSSSAQVAARLCGSTAGKEPRPSAIKQENFKRRNSSSKIYEVLQKTELENIGASEALNVFGARGILVDSAKLRLANFMKRQVGQTSDDHVGELLEHRFITPGCLTAERETRQSGGKALGFPTRDLHDMRGIIHHSYIQDDPPELPKHRSSQIQHLDNPCRWGVDVLNYQLPEPRKLKGCPQLQNLGPGLIPTHSFDEKGPERQDIDTIYRDNARGHLEPSTLYPLENASQRFPHWKRTSQTHADGLDQTCTPFRDQIFRGVRKCEASKSQSHLQSGCVPCNDSKSTRRRCNEMRGAGSLQRDLTPKPLECGRPSRRPPQAIQRDSLYTGSLVPRQSLEP